MEIFYILSPEFWTYGPIMKLESMDLLLLFD